VKTWEYDYVGTVNPEDTVERLNQLGRQGWRVIQKFKTNQDCFLLERGVPDSPPPKPKPANWPRDPLRNPCGDEDPDDQVGD
jgi:hypothetical protein